MVSLVLFVLLLFVCSVVVFWIFCSIGLSGGLSLKLISISSSNCVSCRTRLKSKELLMVLFDGLGVLFPVFFEMVIELPLFGLKLVVD